MTWAAEPLAMEAGAHRGQRGRHCGSISVFTTWAYPPLLPAPPRQPEAGAEAGAAPGEEPGDSGPAR